jgi:hypothetical protein
LTQDQVNDINSNFGVINLGVNAEDFAPAD